MKRLVLLAVAIPLSACAQESSRYPSLQPRPIESRDLSEPVRTPPRAAPDPSLDAQITALRARIAETAKSFDAALQPAESATAAARGAPVGDERWVNAQAALAALSDNRTRAIATASELDQLAIARATDGLPDYPALTEADQAAGAELDRESAAIQRLNGMLPSG